jgi:hypothetical protein
VQPPPDVSQSPARRSPPDEAGDLRVLFHRLNNQLGIILAHSELLESKLPDDQQRSRATRVVAATLEAMSVSRTLRDRLETG